MLFRSLITVLFMTVPTVSQAQAPSPSATELRQGLTGSWSGALGYRDYKTDRLSEIPVTTTIEVLPDGVTMIRRSLFDDGPNKPVWITTVSLDDPAAGTSTSATFRAGRSPSLSTEFVQRSAYRDPYHWTVIYRETAEDDDQPAEIRVTETRNGDSLVSVKDVRPVGADDLAWRFRNQTRLTRVAN
jgi:hypothetical protein